MDINIVTFRRIRDYKFHFENGKITLICGSSGVGKTSILEAITWCLYGSTRDVDDPVGKKKAKVVINIDGYKIIRSKVKCVSIEVEYKNKRYKSKEAEAIIEDKFGPKILWYTSCYLQQDEKIPFLYATSNKAKLEMLNSIAFTDVNPNKEIDLCNQKIVNITSMRDKQISKYDKAKERYLRYKDSLDNIVECTQEELDTIIVQRDTMLSDLKKLKRLRETNDKNKIRHDILTKDITKIEDKIASLTLIPVPDDISDIDSLIKYKKLDNKIKENNTKLDNIPLHADSFTSKYLYEVEQCEKIIEDNTKICNELGIRYDREDISNALQRFESNIKLRDLQKKIREKIDIINFLSKYDDVGEEDLIDSVNKEKSIQSNKKILDGYKIEYDKYVIEDTINSITELLRLQDIIDKIKEREELVNKISNIPDIQVSDRIFTNEDLLETLEIERIIKYNTDLCNKIPIPYDASEISNKQRDIKNTLDKQESIINYEERQKIINKINDLGEIDDLTISFTKQQLLDAIRQEKEIELLKDKHVELGIEYSPNSAKEESDRLENILKYQDLIVQRDKRNAIISKLDTLIVTEVPEHNFTIQDLDIASDKEEIYNTNLAIYNRYNIPYTKDNVNYLTKNSEIIKSYIKRCNYSYCTKEEYERQKDKLKRLQDGLKCISCPNCNTSLVHQNGELKKSSVGISSKEQVLECKIILDKMEKYIDLSRGIPSNFVMRDFANDLSNKDLDILADTKYSDLPEYSSKYIKKQIDTLDKYNSIIKERQIYENKLAKTEEVIIDADIPKLSMLEKKNYTNKLASLNKLTYIPPLEYSSSYIDKHISNEKKYILREKYNKKLNDIPVVNADSVKGIKKLTQVAKKDLESKLNILSTIRVVNKPEYDSTYIKVEMSNRQQYEKNNKLIESYQSKLSKLPEINIAPNIKLVKLSNREKDKYKSKLDALMSIKYVDYPKYSSSLIRDIIYKKNKLSNYIDIPDTIENEIVDVNLESNYSKAKTIKYVDKSLHESSYIKTVIRDNLERDTINKVISEATDKINLINVRTDLSLDELYNIKNNIDKNNITKLAIEREVKSLNSIKEELSSIIIDDKIDSTIKDLDKEIDKINIKISNYKEYIKLKYLKDKYKKYSEEVKETNLSLKSANDVLKEALISAQKEALTEVIGNINYTIGPIIKKLFNEPIHISLSLMKTLKNGKEKDAVSICIRFKSVEYDNISKFSGGEKARINIAFLLTIAKIVDARILLFDEPCKSIEEELVEKCIKAIKSTTNAIKICIAHKETEAKYDKKILLE